MRKNPRTKLFKFLTKRLQRNMPGTNGEYSEIEQNLGKIYIFMNNKKCLEVSTH